MNSKSRFNIILISLVCITVLTIILHYRGHSHELISNFYYFVLVLCALWYGQKSFYVLTYIVALNSISHVFVFRQGLHLLDYERYLALLVLTIVMNVILRKSRRYSDKLVKANRDNKLINQKLEELARYQKEILEGMPVAVFILNEDHRITHWNSACVLLTGLSAEEMLGTSDHWRIFFENREGTLADQILDDLPFDELKTSCCSEIQRNPDNPNSYTAERYFEKEQKWYLITVAAVSWNDGRPTSVIETFIDVTFQKTLMQQLLESSLRFHQIAERAEEWIWETDPEGLYVYSNETVFQILGYLPEDIIGKKHFYDFFHPEVKEEYVAFFREKFKSREDIISFSTRYLHKNGDIVYLKTNGSPFFDKGGKFLGYRGVDIDVTEAFIAEEKLRNSENSLRESQRIARLGQLTFDHSSGKMFWSDEVYAIFEVKPDEIEDVHETFLLSIHPQDRSFVEETLEKAIETGEMYEIIYRLLLKDGSIKFVNEIGSIECNENGEALKSTGTIQDITVLKQIEESLEKNRLLLNEAEKVARIGSWTWSAASTAVTWSNEMYNIYGVKPEDIDLETDDPILTFIHPDDKDALLELRERSRRERTSGELEYRLVMRNGDIKYIHAQTKLNCNEKGDIVNVYGTLQDITDRKMAEIELHRVMQQLKSHLHNNPLAAITFALDQRITGWNQAAESIFGFSRSEALGCFTDELIVPEELRDTIEDINKRLLSQTGGDRSRNVNITKNKERITCEWYNVVLTDEKGNVTGTASLVDDISEDIKRQSDLRNEKERSEKYFNMAQVMLLVLDPDARIVMINDTACQVLEAKREDLLGKNWFDNFIPKDIKDSIKAVFKHSFDKKKDRNEVYENEIVTAKGNIRAVQWQDMLIEDNSGNYSSLLCSGKDVTEIQKIQEKAIQEYQVRLNIVSSLNSAGIGIAIIDENYKITFQSQFLQERFPSIGKKCYSHFFRIDEPCEFCPLSKGNPDSVAFEGTDGNDNIYAIASVLQHLPKEDNIFCIFQDITTQRKLQEQFLQSQKMDALGTFVGGIVHDFNNLLNSILIFRDLCALEPSESSKIHEYLDEIRMGIDHARGLTSQLMAFSRKQIIQPRSLNLNSIVSGMKEMLSRIIGEQISLEIHIEEALNAVKMDPTQVKQILLNLVSNALEAMPAGGKLSIETSNIEVGVDDAAKDYYLSPGKYVHLLISDTGKGISDEILEKIFDPFFTTKGEIGTGLGLPTVYGIVKQNKGEIFVHSELEVGTTFNIFIPQSDAFPVDLNIEKNSGKTLDGEETILLVEDEKMLRRAIARALVSHGYTVLEASDGEKAKMQEKKYEDDIHLLVSDMVLPNRLNGKQISEYIKKKRPDIKVLFMSGFTEDIITKQGIIEENVNFIQKPFNLEMFLYLIRDVLDG